MAVSWAMLVAVITGATGAGVESDALLGTDGAGITAGAVGPDGVGATGTGGSGADGLVGCVGMVGCAGLAGCDGVIGCAGVGGTGETGTTGGVAWPVGGRMGISVSTTLVIGAVSGATVCVTGAVIG